MFSVEYLIARRTAQSHWQSRSSVMTRIAVVTVALALSAMIVTLAVVEGFRHQIYDDLRGFGADVRLVDVSSLTGAESRLPLSTEAIEAAEAVEGVEWVAPYVEVGGVAKSGDNLLGLQIKGVGKDYNLEWWQQRVVEGHLPDIQSEERHKQILLSQSAAQRLGIGVGDRLEMLFVEDGERPRRDNFKVVGLYHTGFEEMDLMLALGDVRDLRRVAGFSSDVVTGYDVWAEPRADADAIAPLLDEVLFEQAQLNEGFISAVAATLQMRHPIVFDWMKAHTVIARSVVLIMMVVLLFNMAASMLIMVFDRIGMIGALKAQGMRTSAIRRIFLLRAMMIFLRGALWGNAVGAALVAVQSRWEVISLNPTGYMLSVLPVDVGWWWLTLNVATLAVAVAVMVLPSMMVASIRPEASLKYKL